MWCCLAFVVSLIGFVEIALLLKTMEGLDRFEEAQEHLPTILGAQKELNSLAKEIHRHSSNPQSTTSLEHAVIQSAMQRLKSIPNTLLTLPRAADIVTARKRRRQHADAATTLGFTPDEYVVVWENRRRMIGVGWHSGFRDVTFDPRPWVKVDDKGEASTLAYAKKALTSTGHFKQEDIVPQPGHVWDGDWALLYDAEGDEDGWR